jgi:hypothetical protein
MNIRLFQEPMDLNLAFEQVIHGLQHLEKVRLFNGEIIRYARADVQSARVDANREFFDNFDDVVASVVRAKAAMRGHFKTGHMEWPGT